MDIGQFIQAVQRYIVQPLDDLPKAQITFLETNHDQSVQDFRQAIGLLTSGSGIFQGKAADAFAAYIGHYLDAENALSPYADGGPPERISTLFKKCADLLTQEEAQIKSIQSGGGIDVGKAVATTAPFGIADPPAEVVIIVGIVAVGIVGATLHQQGQIRDLSNTFNEWASDMQTLAQQPDPPGSELPQVPGEITTAITADTNQLIGQATISILTPEQRRIAREIAKEYGVDEQLVRNLFAYGFTEAQIRQFLSGLSGYSDYYKNQQLAALGARYLSMTPEQEKELEDLDYTDEEIRDALMANQVDLATLIQRTEETKRLAELLESRGVKPEQVRQMLMAGFTMQNMQVIYNRLLQADTAGTDQYGLTKDQLLNLLFGNKGKVDPVTGRGGIVSALLSRDPAVVREGSVARCILDSVTIFDLPQFAPNGRQIGQIDVGTKHFVIEAKIASVSKGAAGQVQEELNNNPGKDVLLYAPNYGPDPTESINALRGTSGNQAFVVKSCADLHQAFRVLGGP